MTTSPPLDLHSWLGLPLSSPAFTANIRSLHAVAASSSSQPDRQQLEPEIKPYRDAVYLNYPTLGLSCMFAPQEGYEPPKAASSLSELEGEKLKLESVDVYNPPPPPPSSSSEPSPPARGKAKSAWSAYSPFPALPYTFHPRANSPPRPPFPLTRSTTGRDLLLALGEPTRKGGGQGPKGGNLGIWLEWTEEGLMVELEAGEASVVQNWEKGGEKVWRVVTLFERGKGGGR